MLDTKHNVIKRTIINPFIKNIEDDFYHQALKNACSYDCMVGYFNSASLKVLSTSILYYLSSNCDHKMRLIISPFLSKQDLNTLKNLYLNQKSLSSIFRFFQLSEDTLQNETLKALAYLIYIDRIEIKLAIPKNGLFHAKCWLFQQNDLSEIIIHGSGNHTYSGLTKNFEYMVLEHSLNSDEEALICKTMRDHFELIWNHKFPNILTANLTLGTINFLLKSFQKEDFNSQLNIVKSLAEAIKQEYKENIMDDLFLKSDAEKIISSYQPIDLSIPHWLNYKSGDYKHQGDAINAWFENGKKGILSIATGGGKTITSLIAATLLSKQLDSLLVVISVPTKALMEQWQSEVKLFGLDAINFNHFPNKQQKNNAIKKAGKLLKFKSSKVEVIILSHDALKSDLVRELEKCSSSTPMLLIADEVHNLGSDGFISNPPQFFHYKLGLSATAIRQYDSEGTAFLFDYFGKVIFDYPLEEAIGKCLTTYKYYTHTLTLTTEEEYLFSELTEKIKRLSYAATMSKHSDEFKLWSNYCIQRRRIIETASQKINKLKETLDKNHKEIAYTLLFCSDKDPEQLEQVNNLLHAYHINYHQITGQETSNIALLNHLIGDYNSGKLQVLTSKRVLDEGFNVPQTKTAYLLASNTTKKQWVQRLGRVLRQAPGKEFAEVHDFIVLPTINDENIDSDFINLLKSESERIFFFSKNSTNGVEQGGSVRILTQILNIIDNNTEKE